MTATKKTQRQNYKCKRALKDLCVTFFLPLHKKLDSLSTAWTQKYSQERTQCKLRLTLNLSVSLQTFSQKVNI